MSVPKIVDHIKMNTQSNKANVKWYAKAYSQYNIRPQRRREDSLDTHMILDYMYMNCSDDIIDAIVRDRFPPGTIQRESLLNKTKAANIKGIMYNDKRNHSYIGTPL